MNHKSDQQLITPNSNTAKPFMHQGREKKNYDPEALMVNHDKKLVFLASWIRDYLQLCFNTNP